MQNISKSLLATLPVFALGSYALAQCPSPDWFKGSGVDGVPGIQGYADAFGGIVGDVRCATMWDQDGPGPLPARLVVGGYFSFAGKDRAEGLAMWDGTQWKDLGADIASGVMALATGTDHRLLVGGYFTQAGGTPANSIAAFDGTNWSTFGSGVDGSISSIVVRANGHVIVGGYFPFAGGVSANSIARWNGSAWTALDAGVRLLGEIGNINGMAMLANGDIAIAGGFDEAGTGAASNIATLRFNANGSLTWTTLGTGIDMPGFAQTVHAMPNGDLIVGGEFTFAGGNFANNIARWNGTTWSALGGGTDGAVLTLNHTSAGHILAGGYFNNADGALARGLGRWDGSAWSAYPAMDPFHYSHYDAQVYAILVDSSDELTVGGQLDGGVAHSTAGVWSNFGLGFDASVTEILPLPSGELLVAGPFESTPGGGAHRIARLAASTWSPLGAGVDVLTNAMLRLANGDILVAGFRVDAATGKADAEVYRWNGSTWTLHSTDLAAFDLLQRPNGELLATGNKDGMGGLFRWDGSAWALLGDQFSRTGDFAQPSEMVLLSNGNVVVTGIFDSAGGTPANNVARWDGAAWHAMGNGVGDPAAFEGGWDLVALPNDHVVVVGTFPFDVTFKTLNNVAEWDGSQWNAMGSGIPDSFPFSVARAATGEIYVGGALAGGSVQRWDGGLWTPVGPEVEGTTYAVAVATDGTIAVGGNFAYVGGVPSANFARYGCEVAPCYADCDASGSLNIDDFICFQTNFAIGSNAADCDSSGSLDIDDFICFQTFFALGC